jgi:hypothetical protein
MRVPCVSHVCVAALAGLVPAPNTRQHSKHTPHRATRPHQPTHPRAHLQHQHVAQCCLRRLARLQAHAPVHHDLAATAGGIAQRDSRVPEPRQAQAALRATVWGVAGLPLHAAAVVCVWCLLLLCVCVRCASWVPSPPLTAAWCGTTTQSPRCAMLTQNVTDAS